MVRFLRSCPRFLPMALAGTLLASLGGCAAVPIGQLAYQAATAPSTNCAPGVGTLGVSAGGCGPSALTSMWDGLKGELAGR